MKFSNATGPEPDSHSLPPCRPRLGRHQVRFCDPVAHQAHVCDHIPTYGALDSGATDNFLPITYNGRHHNSDHAPIQVSCANGSHMESVATDQLNLPRLPQGARACYKFNDVHLPLISVPKLCEHDCQVTFNKDSVVVTGPNGHPVLSGKRDPINQLYMVPLHDSPSSLDTPRRLHTHTVHHYKPNNAGLVTPTHHGDHRVVPRVNSTAGSAYEQRIVPKLINYLHATAGFPTKPTWIQAVNNGNYISWPGLTPERIRNHLQKSIHTVKGHLHKVRQGIRSTTNTPNSINTKIPTKYHDVTPMIMNLQDVVDHTNTLSWDLTGKYPTTSARGNKYIFVMYDHDANYIHAIPIKNRTTTHLVQAFQEGYEMFKQRGLLARLVKMDNEVSKELIQYIQRNSLDYQIVSPGDHRQNHAERAIQTFKNHFISILSGVDEEYPANAWDLLIPHAIVTLNLLRQSRIQPRLSAFAQVHGHFDFNKTPLAPAGCKVIIHERPHQRGTWEDHGIEGFYTGPALKHYRNYVCLVKGQNSRRISNTVEFFPTCCEIPQTSSTDKLTMIIADLKAAIENPHAPGPYINQGTELNEALRGLQELINTTETYNKKLTDKITVRKRRRAPRVQKTDKAKERALTTRRHERPFPFKIPTPKTTTQHQANSGSIWDEELKKMAAYRDLINHPNRAIRDLWLKSGEDEFGRLFQGFKPNNIEGMDVLEWINKNEVPQDKKVTYPRYTVAIRPEKADPYRTRITAGGDRLTYDGDVTTNVATMETVKTHWTSVVSTPGAKYCTGDISNMYLCSTLDEPEYVRFRYDLIPPRIIEYYGLETLVHEGYVYAKINKAWYGLKQSGRIAHDDLVAHLAKYGYVKSKHTVGLFLHKTRNISFTLVVDDFGIKYVEREDVEHLIEKVREKYPFKVDWEGKQYIGIHLKWDYSKRQVTASMDGYVEQALKEFEHLVPKRHCLSPSRVERPDYGQKVQYVKIDDSPTISAAQKKYIQQVTGKFLFYARAIDNTMLHALNDIARATDKQSTLEATKHFLNYAASNPNARIVYRASDMILTTDSDAAYLVCPEAKSRAGGYHYLTNKEGSLFNGPVLVLAKVIKNVMASAAEAEVGALYMNAQEALPIRQCLIELGHPQPATPLKTDNSTAQGILTGTIKQKRSKAIDMRFYWLKDRAEQGQFKIYWEPGSHNLADYPTKHHTGAHHKKVRPIYLYDEDNSPSTIQGCIEILKKNATHVRPMEKESEDKNRCSQEGTRQTGNNKTS